MAKTQVELIALITYSEAAKAQKYVMEVYPHLVIRMQI